MPVLENWFHTKAKDSTLTIIGELHDAGGRIITRIFTASNVVARNGDKIITEDDDAYTLGNPSPEHLKLDPDVRLNLLGILPIRTGPAAPEGPSTP